MMGNAKYDREGGIHRVPIWRIGGFALNNTATNIWLLLMSFIAYYINGWVGLGVVLAGSFSMIMRIWDGVTDPFVGYLLDKTNGRLGKNRPFMVIGNIVLAFCAFLMIFVTPVIPAGALRVGWFIAVNCIYYLGYTCQCVVTKAAQTCLTNDPKQRPLFSVFDAIYNLILFSGGQMFIAGLAKKYGGFTKDIMLYKELWMIVASVSAVFTVIAVISIWPKDQEKYYGTGQAIRVTFRDYFETIRHNRAIQMLVLAASTDKLGATAKTAAVTTIMFGVVAGNYALSGTFTLYTAIGNIIFIFLGLGYIATKFGQRRAMVTSSWLALFGNIALIALWMLGDPRTLNLPGNKGFVGFSFFTVALLVLTIFTGGFQNVAGSIVIPMTADCADFETYRTGKYVPGLMGTLFSFVDKLVSSFAPFIASICLAAIGFKDVMPDVDTPYSLQLKVVGVFLMYGLIVFGLICNLIAMKFYPLTAEKMEEVRRQIAQIKEAKETVQAGS